MRHTWRIGHRAYNSLIKSVQQGSVSTAGASTGSTTIAAVDPNNAIVLHNGHRHDSGYGLGADGGVLTITNATTVSITKITYAGGVDIVTFTVIEFWPGVIKSIQRGYASFGASTSTVNVTIAAVNLKRVGLFPCGRHRYYADSGLPGGGGTSSESYGSLTSATNLQFVKQSGGDGSGGESSIEGYQVVEFW